MREAALHAVRWQRFEGGPGEWGGGGGVYRCDGVEDHDGFSLRDESCRVHRVKAAIANANANVNANANANANASAGVGDAAASAPAMRR